MAFRSEETSVMKSRLRFQDQSSEQSMPPVRSTPDLFKSASREHLFQSSAIRSISNKENHSTRASNQSFELREDPSFWKDHNVQVIIRIRPLSSSEISVQGSNTCVRQDSCQTVTWTGHPESRFTFDLVADENVSQENLFKVAGVPMVENCVGGYNSCMFAYGQTGSGKTHTMLGDIEGGTRRHSVNCGMTPRVFEYLFSRIQKEKEARKEEKLKFTCKCSFLEIYNEQILDLLDPSSTNLQIREDTKKGVHVDNLKEIEVTTARDVIDQLVQGAANRKVAATNMNRASSRSHSVFTCIIESKWESQGVDHHRFARLNLVDLAGSERQKSSGAEGERLKEATNINKSLSTLGLVIMNLISVSNGKSHHVPYRDSKLTFLLQDSLGGNSKTTIIANISPSTCCSLETLSTLKFAQRAKFIKNHAIVNEDASGDVLAMRMQIQQLKKEVSRLRGLGQGDSENHGDDISAVNFLGSPGPFKWEGLQGSLTPLTSDKRTSQRKEYEVALVGAFRREKDKDTALQALLAENQAAMQLAKQREDEIQGLKMRLRFREAGIKRLEVISSGKMSAETHLLKEKEELLKEIEVLRAQVDRNQEVTRFAMENLRLKEEIRRLKSFYEDGEQERMNEQISILEDKLLEALDWKLMHESDSTELQKRNLELDMEIHGDDNLLASSKEQGSPWRTSINEENEFLKMQAIQNQSEMEGLRKKLNVFLEEKTRLERQVNDLIAELEAERSSKVQEKENRNSTSEVPISDHMDLKTMVDAIATASQREAEAHETAILLSKENEELRVKIKVLIEDNNKLIELYERAASENTNKSMDIVQMPQESNNALPSHHQEEFTEEMNLRAKAEIENLEHQLSEMHEENEKLMGLYEKAMQERDEFKRKVSYGGQEIIGSPSNFSVQEKLVEVDEGDSLKVVEECNVPIEENYSTESSYVPDDSCKISGNTQIDDLMVDEHEHPSSVAANEQVFEKVEWEDDEEEKCNFSDERKMPMEEADEPSLCHEHDEATSLNLTTVKVSEDLETVITKLDIAQDQLLSSAQTITLFGSLEKAIHEVDKLSKEIESREEAIQMKQHQYASLKALSSEMHQTRALMDKKFMALKNSLSKFCSSVGYFEQREDQAIARVKSSSFYLDQKKEELLRLECLKDEIENDHRKLQEREDELKTRVLELGTKVEEESRRQEKERVLLAIDNLEISEVSSSKRNWHLTGKATDLLKSEEEKTKMQSEMKIAQEKLRVVTKEVEEMDKKLRKVESKIQVVQIEVQKGKKSVEEMEQKLRAVVEEKETIVEMKENGHDEVQKMIVEYQQNVFDLELKEEEMKMVEDEVQEEFAAVSELRGKKAAAVERKEQLLESVECETCLGQIQDIVSVVNECCLVLSSF